MEQYGAYLAYGKLQASIDVAKDTTGELALIVPTPIIAAAAGLAGMAVGMTSLATSLVAATFPFAYALTPAFGAIAVGGPAAIVTAAIVLGVLQGINVVKSSQKKGKLESAVERQTRERPDIAELLTTEKGRQEVYGAFLDQTILDEGCSWTGRYCITPWPGIRASAAAGGRCSRANFYDEPGEWFPRFSGGSVPVHGMGPDRQDSADRGWLVPC